MKSKILNVSGIILTIIGMAMLLFGMTNIVIIVQQNILTDNYITKDVPCYDRYSSVIQGAVCTEKVYPWQDEAIETSGFMTIGSFILIFGIIIKGSANE